MSINTEEHTILPENTWDKWKIENTWDKPIQEYKERPIK